MRVLIIGGSSDLGCNLAKHLSDLGNQVIVTYHKNKRQIDNIEYLHLDITNEDKITNVFKYIINKYKKIDLLINMAAISYDNFFINNTKEEFMKLLEINLVGSFLTSKVYSEYTSNGIILNIASTDGIDTYSEYSMLYSASKAAMINMSKSMAMGTTNKVLCICPNWIDSESTRNMNQEYLHNELKRINQNRLISIEEFCQSVSKIINDYESGDIVRIDIKGDKLWIEKVL